MSGMSSEPSPSRRRDGNQILKAAVKKAFCKVMLPMITLLDLPYEAIQHVAQHIEYNTIFAFMGACKELRAHTWNTWRIQAWLLRTSWGTSANYRKCFDMHVSNRLLSDSHEATEVGVNIVYNFIFYEGSTSSPLNSIQRRERARIAMANAKRVFDNTLHAFFDQSREEFESYESAEKQLTRRLSAIHSPLEILFLRPNTNFTFKDALWRLLAEYKIPWKVNVAKTRDTPNFIAGNDPVVLAK